MRRQQFRLRSLFLASCPEKLAAGLARPVAGQQRT
jgi:hypothetical protein